MGKEAVRKKKKKRDSGERDSEKRRIRKKGQR